MFKINILGIVFLNFSLMIYVAQSMEEDKKDEERGSDTPEINFNQPGEPFQFTLTKITFPNEKEKLIEEITKGSPCIHIYIPNGHSNASNQKTIDFPEYTSPELENLKYLVINHSLGSERGYQRDVVNTLIPLVKSALKLEKLMLSQALADDFLPYIRPNIHVFLDCRCNHNVSDTLYPQDYLTSLNHNLLQYYQQQYPLLQISALEIKGFIDTTL